jgi:hypothetical protein
MSSNSAPGFKKHPNHRIARQGTCVRVQVDSIAVAPE